MKLSLMIKLRAVQGEMLIHVILKSINTARKIFFMQIEDGEEVFIPKELSQDGLPFSFRFYDPVLISIQAFCSEAAREKFQLKNKIALERYVADDLVMTVIDKLQSEGGLKVEHKHKVLKSRSLDILDPLNSEHVSSLQRSKYVSVEKDLRILHKRMKITQN